MGTLILFDDSTASGWKPFTWTRPAGELVYGACSFRERAERVTGFSCAGHISPTLSGFDEPGVPGVIDPGSVDRSVARVYLCSRFAIGGTWAEPAAESALVCDGVPVGWFAPAGTAGPPPEFMVAPDTVPAGLPTVEVAGELLAGFWQIVTGHSARLVEDLRWLADAASDTAPPGVTLLGTGGGGLLLGSGVEIEPGVVIDCAAGPVWLEDGVRVRAYTRIAGPARIGPGTTLLGGSFDGVTIGPACKVRGELEASVILGYSNKAHDGFIGHALIGRWVNLGALTTNSDLKNNYGPVRIRTEAGEVDTGSMKVGCFIGDHVKTAIGTLLNTGTVIGPGSNIFGTGMPAKYVAPFSWGGDGSAVHAFDRFLDTAAIAMGRRGVPLTPGVRHVLERAWTESRESAS